MYYQQQQPFQQPYPQVTPAGPKLSPGVLVGVSLWRLVIVACAFIGFGAALSRSSFASAMPALSQQASLLAGVVYVGLLLYPAFTGGRRHEPKSPWWRGSMVILLILVSVTFITIIGGKLNQTWSLFEHLITPLAVLIDYLVVGRNQTAAKWWHPFTWLIFPLAYLVYYLSADLKFYGKFLNPHKDAFPGVIAGFIAALLALGFLLYGFGKMKAAARQQQGIPGQGMMMSPQAMAQQQYYQQQPQPGYPQDYSQQQAAYPQPQQQQPYPTQTPPGYYPNR
jgi:hypothetical protein